MSDVVISPNMNLPVPVVSEEPGPSWATDLNACLSGVDSHNHSSGQGVQITPAGINVNADLPINGNNVTTAKSVRFTAQNSPLAGGSDLGCIYVSGADLYYNDENGNQVRITQSGSVTGSTGTITGLPSGTASASFAASTFTFQSATNTPATMAVGPLVIGAAIANSKTVTISPPVTLAANYALTTPAALPASTSFLTTDVSGNQAFVASTGSGSVVLATTPTITTPNFSGNSTGTILGDVYTPTVTFTYVSGATITVTLGAQAFSYTRVGKVVSVSGFQRYTTSGYTADAFYSCSATLPIATASLHMAGIAIISSRAFQLSANESALALTNGNIQFIGNSTSYISFLFSYDIS